MLWMSVTITAAAFQVGRNGLQRGMMSRTGPWGATLVRFLFGMPFSVLLTVAAFLVTPDPHLEFSAAFWLPALAGALSQLLATAALLVAMERAGFAVATALQQSSVPLAAIVGLAVFGDNLHALAWVGVACTTGGLAVLVWPDRKAAARTSGSGVLLGVLSGLFFGFALNAFRHAGLHLEPHHPFLSAMASVAIVQAVQSIGLGAFLAVKDRAALRSIVLCWRSSLGAGLLGSCASAVGFWR